MIYSEKKKDLQIVFVSHDQAESTDYLVALLNRHPEICVFDGTDLLIDNLLKFPDASFSIHNTIFFELLFELINDHRFQSAAFTVNAFDEVSKSKSCYDAFKKLMQLYCTKTKPTAVTLAYRFPQPINFKELFNSYVIRDLRAKYIHQSNTVFLKNEPAHKNSSETILSSICNGVLQVKQQDFTTNYEYEYKRLFRFLSSAVTEIPEPKKKTKKLYKTSKKLAEMQNSWFSQIVAKNEAVREKVYIHSPFNI